MFCSCHEIHLVDNPNSERAVVTSALEVVKMINAELVSKESLMEFVAGTTQKCALLEFSTLLYARIVFAKKKEKSREQRLEISFLVKPYNAEFKAFSIVGIDKENHLNIIIEENSIDRGDRYSLTSSCLIETSILKMYCICQ